MNRGVEIDSDVADGEHAVILNQVTNGVAVRMAVLYLLAGFDPLRARDAKEGVELEPERDETPRPRRARRAPHPADLAATRP
jgi:hypothetical protein